MLRCTMLLDEPLCPDRQAARQAPAPVAPNGRTRIPHARTDPYAVALRLRIPAGSPWLARVPLELSVSGRPAGAAPIRA